MQVYKVTQVTVIRQKESPLTLLVQAFGLTSSTGWINPRLDNSKDPTPTDAAHELSFDAERPSGISLQVLSPTTASVVLEPKNGADAVIVSARTNSITVHASEFLDPTTLPQRPFPGGPVTTLAIGEEGLPITLKVGEEHWTTLRLGEEGPWTDPRSDDPIDPLDDWLGRRGSGSGVGPIAGAAGGPFGRFR
jgi:hypothetical protein